MEHSEHFVSIRDWFRIDVYGRESPDASDFYDRDWLQVGFSAQDRVSQVCICGPYLLTSEIEELHGCVRDLLKNKTAGFQFRPTEPILNLRCRKKDELGHYELAVWLQSEFDRDNGLKSTHDFTFQIDQTDLPLLDRQLWGILQEYPVIGRP